MALFGASSVFTQNLLSTARSGKSNWNALRAGKLRAAVLNQPNELGRV